MVSWISGIVLVLFFWKIIIPLLVITFRYTLGRKWYSKRKQLLHAGKWAVITEATGAIGKAYAEELASDGLNIMIISHAQEDLDALAKEIQSKYKVEVRPVQADFAQVDIYEKLRIEIDELPSIACLVNNAEMVNADPLSFPYSDDMSVDKIGQYIACNCVSMASMTHIVLPKLIKQQSGAALINLSSFPGCNPLPYLALYSGTKAFDRQLSTSLSLELKGCNVIVQTICPMYVATAMGEKCHGYFVIDPREYVRSALDHLGVEEFTHGHIRHALQFLYFSLLPQFLFNHSMEQKYLRAARRKLKQQKEE